MTTHRAAGLFEVKVAPLAMEAAATQAGIARLSLDKAWHGDLEGHSVGQMLACGSPGSGAAAYVALEMVTGTLQGRKGSFVLQHLGTMSGSAQSMRISIVPGSGAGDLAGISGTLAIEIGKGGEHSYVLEYSL